MQNLDYGVIGNSKSAALISRNGSLEWACMPEFDSPSIFGKLLDREKGGSFEIFVDDSYEVSQKYLKRTNLLVTTYRSGSDAFEVIDFMPRYKLNDSTYNTPPEIVRLFRHVSGTPVFRVKYDPRLQYARGETKSVSAKGFIKSYTHEPTYDSLYLYSDLCNDVILNSEPVEMTGDHYFLVSYNQKLININHSWIELEMEKTKVYWLDWVHRTRHFSQYQEEIERSALVLKLLTYQKTGAIIAAVTTSLPEKIGEERNWDYRFSWIRDSSMIIKTLIRLNHYNVAKRYMNFILNLITYKDDLIQIMYGIRGEKKLTETTLDHLSGYEGSKPIRIGNDAYHQKQNDIYGVLLDVIHQHLKINSKTIDEKENFWTVTRSILKSVRVNWDKPDKSIWEIRSQSRHFTFSKVLSWVAFDRGVKIATLLGQTYYADWWSEIRDTIKENILKHGWNEEMQAFTQSYGSQYMDASNLLMERYGFIDASDPRYVSTVKVTKEKLLKNDLMYRYRNEDDLGIPEVSFSICTFWMITSLYKIGEYKEARRLFENVMKNSNHLGLFSEDMDFDSKRLLGNFPQGYSHLALIESAIMLSGVDEEDK
ncbi:MAG: glycoside hydrolase family 15 protein [Bacteroidales bacterium]